VTNDFDYSPDHIATIKSNFDHTVAANSLSVNHFNNKHSINYIKAVNLNHNNLANYFDHSYYIPYFSWCNIAGLKYQLLINYHCRSNSDFNYHTVSFLIVNSHRSFCESLAGHDISNSVLIISIICSYSYTSI